MTRDDPSGRLGTTVGYVGRHASIGLAGKARGRLGRLKRSATGRAIALTALVNVALNVVNALTAVIVARAAGPAIRGEYSAVTAWFAVVLLFAELGQPIAVCFYVARDPQRARAYLATSLVITLAITLVMTPAGLLLAPLLGHGHAGLTTAYRIAYACIAFSAVGDCFTYALMGSALHVWNKVRVAQPLTVLIVVIVAWRLRLLTIDTMLLAYAGSLFLQLVVSYWWCRRAGLTSGRLQRSLIRQLARYGSAQIVTIAPAAINTSLDQLILSLAVPPAELGYYSVAVSLTILPVPVVSAIGFVLLPRLAAHDGEAAATSRLQWYAVGASAGLAAAILLPIALLSPWLVPAVLGVAYRQAVPLVLILTPGGIFLSCNQVIANVLRGVDRSLVAARAEGIGVIFTIALLAALIPPFGVTGAAIASTLPYGISFALMVRHLRGIPREAGACGPLNVNEAAPA